MTRRSPGNKLTDVLTAAEEGLAALRGGRKLVRRVVKIADPADFTPERVVRIRKRLGVDQAKFAEILATSLATIRGWEAGSKTPAGAARRLLQIAERDPDALTRCLQIAM